MMHDFLNNEYLFWLLVLAFYCFDNLKSVNSSELLIAETITGKYKALFSFNHFEIKGQQVQLLNLLIPFAGFLKLNIEPKKNPEINYIETKNNLLLFQEYVFHFKLISIFSFLYLLSGPVLTYYHGLGLTLLFLLPIHLTTLLITFLCLYFHKSKLGFQFKIIFLIFLDCLFVPAYLPNIVRKIYNKKSFEFQCDGYYFALQNLPDHQENNEREELEYNIQRKIKDDAQILTGNPNHPDYVLYQKTLKINDRELKEFESE